MDDLEQAHRGLLDSVARYAEDRLSRERFGPQRLVDVAELAKEVMGVTMDVVNGAYAEFDKMADDRTKRTEARMLESDRRIEAGLDNMARFLTAQREKTQLLERLRDKLSKPTNG